MHESVDFSATELFQRDKKCQIDTNQISKIM